MCLPWQKPPDHRFKLNIDGSFKPKTIKGGTGGMIRNHSGQWIMGFACHCSSNWKDHTPWEANGVADALAEYGRKTKDPTMIVNKLHIFDASPSFATNILERDANGTASARSVPFCMDNPL
ncbi:hypothetical protein H5410_016963 [Solanum commersonii]|uniref:RNase H type-1 domain-containing protein n=1 Tax=Solanum commersonii TaxID=4109 RepID=A0A9J5ZYI8_SOLCO|nr:hypothetical protein H5410_016963 [Solanum commersonii]